MEAQMALSLLSNCKQKPDENIHIFTERVCAEAAYNNQGGDAIDCQLIDLFVDGLKNNQLRLKILRDHPNTLQAAVGVATNEQNLRAYVTYQDKWTSGSWPLTRSNV